MSFTSQISLQISYCLPRPEFSVMSQKPICIFFPQCLPQLFKVYFLPKIPYHTTLNMVLLPLWNPNNTSICSSSGKPSISSKKTPAWLTDTVLALPHTEMAYLGIGKPRCHLSFHKRMSRLLSARVIMYLSWIRNKSLKSLPGNLTLLGLLPNFY